MPVLLSASSGSLQSSMSSVAFGLLGVVVASMVLSAGLVWLVRRMSLRVAALDGVGVAGQVKEAPRRVPNTGGIGVVLAMLLTIGLGVLVMLEPPLRAMVIERVPELARHLPGLQSQLPALGILLGAVAVLHIMGVMDDRKPLAALPKLLVMLIVAGAVVLLLDRTRVLTLLDASVGGPWLSVLITIAWIVAVTNALNFIDNMDGLCGGVTAIAGSALLVIAIMHGQWFIGAMLAVLVGGVLGFLIFNFPLRRPATIFMGDGGSLVCGFLLAVLSIRLTYVHVDASSAMPGPLAHVVLVPLVVLAVPLYDLVSVTLLRISQGKSPLVGDLQHLSHRLHFRGLSRRAAVTVICGLTAITALGGVLLPTLATWQAILIFGQTGAALVVLAIVEFRARKAS
ncbi:MAG: undecaprenyl/decaprenyl-phosphate alpha-N-acetylglucosaminyl 1-phosphate transferase [Phycisphaerales bacterium]|jgi:UDP-GlcNAc:undecaprenyl-phosphate GlcNAc-1-phosphate transferase|nr:undecaprenyl/decaprenyl-phosphate alpha-N-acetylglucosaminyl 1-phosphate transferase [Phycisphaerales bacterium]